MFRFTFLIFAAVGFCLAGGGAKAQSPQDNVSAKAKPGERAQTWTRARRTQAVPMPLPNVDPQSVLRRGGGQTETEEEEEEEEKQGSGPGGGGSGERQSGDIQERPLVWAGKLFFRSSQGDMVCSAQFIRPRVILTAAHCVQDKDTGQFYSNFNFYLQYRRGQYSHRYDWDCVGTKNGWVLEGWRWDYAMIRVRGSTRTGHFGWSYGWAGSYDSAVIIGYPSDIASGEVIQVESGPLRVLEGGLVEVRQGDPDFGPGSSGGAWVGDYTTRNRANYVLTVMSFGYTETPEYSYGPYFDSEFENLLNYVENGCE